MAQAQDLPVEILVFIFQQIYSSEYAAISQGLATIPFNVASVCRLWRDVAMSTIPGQYWTSIVFDLKENPQPLLSVFSVSGDRTFSLLVVTTADDTTEEGTRIENLRARRIVKHLHQYAERCTSIVFDVMFASSLPSLAPFFARNLPNLKEITLTYKIQDESNYYEDIQKIDMNPGPVDLTNLGMVSMHGSAFMDILRLGKDRLTRFKIGRQTNLQIYLHHLRFPIPSDDTGKEEYNFEDFIYLLRLFHGGIFNLHLKQCSLGYRPHTRVTRTRLYDFDNTKWQNLSFESVTKDFITEFFKVGANYRPHIRTFNNCSIPTICRTPGWKLTLNNIPSTSEPSIPDESIYNALNGWGAEGYLCFNSCPAFNDDLIRWLAQDRNDGECEAYGIQFIDIDDCTNFTPSILFDLISVINRPDRTIPANDNRSQARMLRYVSASGRLPQLKEEDLEWFKNYKGNTTIYWAITDENGEKIELKAPGCY